MSKNEEQIDFVVRDGVALYAGRGAAARRPGSTVRLPKSHAQALAHPHKPAAEASQVEAAAE